MRGFLSFKERNRVKVEQMREEDLHYKKVVQPSLQSCVILKEGNAREREKCF